MGKSPLSHRMTYAHTLWIKLWTLCISRFESIMIFGRGTDMIVTSERQALCVAVEMERRAIRVYERAAALAADEEVRRGVEEILAQEREHLARFQAMREAYPADAAEERALLQAMGAEALFPGGVAELSRADGLRNLAGLCRFAVESERDAVAAYLSFAEKCRDEKVAEAFRAVAGEETQHLAAFQARADAVT